MSSTSDFAVVRSIVVNVEQSQAFDRFIDMTSWWPLDTHTIGAAPARASIIEPRAGGRWYGIDANGEEHGIGHVLEYEPPHRILLTWEITHDWHYDEHVKTEIEVEFRVEGPLNTRVTLEHRRFDVYGERAAAQRATYEADDAWTYVLSCYGRVAHAAERPK